MRLPARGTGLDPDEAKPPGWSDRVLNPWQTLADVGDSDDDFEEGVILGDLDEKDEDLSEQAIHEARLAGKLAIDDEDAEDEEGDEEEGLHDVLSGRRAAGRRHGNPDGVYNYVVDTNFESKISQIAGYTGFDDTASFPCVPWFERGSDNPGCVNQTISKRAVSLNASEDAV
ncbi:MAG: hypothetical protein LQ341_006530 [Variospora aurantia]|nr:MAG: hypothetical protein LQ341_006530 [Variospora aurantia]